MESAPAAIDPGLAGAPGWRKALLAVARSLPDQVLVEQLRLVHRNAALSFGATFAAAAMTVWLFQSADQSNQSNQSNHLIVWMAAVGAGCVATILLAHWFLRSHQTRADAMRTYWLTFVLYSLYAVLWGLLPWLTLHSASGLHTIWVVCVMAGVLAGGMTFMAPLLPVYCAFAVLLVLPLAVQFLLRSEQVFMILGWGAILMSATLIGQATQISRSLRGMIDLRFSREALLEQLRSESARAKQAQAGAEAARRDAESAHQEADTARQAAEAADLAKSKFLAFASHDLRQPIHALGLFLEVLGSTSLTVHQVEMLASARMASRASQEMLNTLLDFSRIEAGVVQPHRQPVALQALLYKIENDLAPLADAKSLAYRFTETAAVVDADAALVEMILRNLISNAIRYTERGGVLIACRPRSGMLVVEVHDTGIGIAPEHLEEVFREFHQLGNPERDRRKGLGLGLAIAKGLADACGHSLSLASRPGRGSTFRLTLPLTPAAALPAVPAAGAIGPPAVRGVRVLVLDDDEAVRAGMAHLLRSWDCQCDTAETISEAMAVAHQQPPAIFITDYRLRGQDSGTAALAAARALLGADLPALMITGDTAPARLRETLASGVPLLHKPVGPEQLRAALEQLMPFVREREARKVQRTTTGPE